MKNNKELLNFLFRTMEKLERKEIEVNNAQAQASLAKQANNVLKYEVDKARVQMQLDKHNREFDANIHIKNIEDDN